jgi:predicted AAA+ superfamily ATPase
MYCWKGEAVKYAKRFYPLEFPKGQSIILLGPRKTGKTTFLKQTFPNSLFIDLLQSDLTRKYSTHPERLRQELLLLKKEQKELPIIIDEVQLIPALLNEIHWLIENAGLYFILCGSSTRRLRASGVNLLGGRAWTYHFFPFIYPELKPYDLPRILEHGTIPSHYFSSSYQKHLQAYVHDYLTLEIKQEGLVRNLPAFQHFLEVAAFSNGQLINYANIAREAGVNEKTIKAYFDILEDSLVGNRLPPYSKVQKRDLIFKANKFYFFDVGLINALKRNASPLQAQENKGHILESYIFQELNAYRYLREDKIPLSFWRTTTGLEVDFILNDQIAIEVKLSQNIHQSHLKGLVAFAEEHPSKELIVVCYEEIPRLITYKGHNIKIFNVESFLERLWSHEFT